MVASTGGHARGAVGQQAGQQQQLGQPQGQQVSNRRRGRRGTPGSSGSIMSSIMSCRGATKAAGAAVVPVGQASKLKFSESLQRDELLSSETF